MKTKAVLTLAAATLIFTGCGAQNNGGNNTADKATDSSNAVQAADNKAVSGKLDFYTSEPEEDATKLIAAFNKKFPNVKVETFRSGTEEVVAKIEAEKQAGAVQADVLLAADSITFEGLKKEDMLLSYKSPEASTIPDDLKDPDGTYTGTKVMATVLAINTDQVKTAPDSWNVLKDEASKNSAIMPSPLYSGAAAYNIGVFSRTDGFGWDYLKGLKDNGMSVIKGNGAVIQAVASGEKNYGMVVDYLVAREKANGSHIDLVYPKEGVPIITEPIGIMKDTDNAAAAQAFVDFVLSEDGQKTAAEIGYTPIREGVTPPAGLKSISEFNVLSGDLATLASAREADKKQFTDVFGNE
ncbi:ABC transporter substrate-binding protein [Paenibacillus protaetiae]|uniref:Extracellular solute-binding protein n=1 Tax=Paenibacillus protaetiae TaxID=2509456 RepID=A0A4P6EXY6_9BACL|nr:ABC transporter substrate-binding protein [Paenibacillus protaetiae]QAY67545.1 extracellular solute-binding protein [Paenibacillus protaetiae]